MRVSLRFEVFSRDGFICRYCGRRAPDVVLEVDHIHPVSEGGTDDLWNLNTSCFECNRGKAARLLGEAPPRPDLDKAAGKMQDDAELLQRYMAAKKLQDAAVALAVDALRTFWATELTPKWQPEDAQLKTYILRFGLEESREAVIIAAQAHARKKFGYSTDYVIGRYSLVPYIAGILRRRAQRAGEQSAVLAGECVS